MDDTTEHTFDPSSAAAIIEHANNLAEAQFDTAEAEQTFASPVRYAALPEKRRIQSLKPIANQGLDKPERRAGESVHSTIDSLILHANTHKEEGTAAFLDRTDNQLVVIYDYNDAEALSAPTTRPNWRQYRAVYPFPISDEWATWQAHNKRRLEMAGFAAHIDNLILCVIEPPDVRGLSKEDIAALSEGGMRMHELASAIGGKWGGRDALRQLSRGVTINESNMATVSIDRDTGEQTISWKVEHRDAKDKAAIPNLFCIGVQFFVGGDYYRMAARLRHQKRDGAIFLTYELQDVQRIMDHAYGEVAERFAEATGLHVYSGRPEGPVPFPDHTVA